MRSPEFISAPPKFSAYGTVSHALPLDLEEPVRLEMTEQLNQLLADTMTLRDLYKKSHWQVAGPTFYQLHLSIRQAFGEQVEIVDMIAERIQLLGGVSSPWPLMLQRRLALSVRHAAGKRSQFRFHVFSMRTRSSLDIAANYQDARPNLVMMERTTWSISDVLRANELQVLVFERASG